MRPRWSSSPVVLVAALAAVLLAGCSSNERLDVTRELGKKKPGEAATPLSVTIAPLEIEKDAFASVEGNAYSQGIPIASAAELREELTAAVRASGAFSAVLGPDFVDRLAEREGLAAVSSEAAARDRTRAPIARGEVLDGAWKRGDPLVLQLKLKRHAVAYKARNGWFVPNLILFAFWIWPAWFVADEQYESDYAIEARLLASGTGREVWSRSYGPEPRVVRDVDHLERGWKLVGHFTVPGSLDSENYQRIGDLVLPYARLAAGEELAKDLRALAPALNGAEGAEGLKKTLAVVAGVRHYASRAIDDLPFAVYDAQDVSALLEKRGGVPLRAITHLEDERATRDALRAALADMASRAQSSDTVVFYYAGYGTVHAGEPRLVPFDGTPGDGASLLALSEVVSVLARSRAKHKVVVIDASFGAPGAGTRTLAGTEPAKLGPVFQPLAAQVTLCLATEPGQAAVDARLDKRGLFTSTLLQAVDEAPDPDGDGWLSLDDLFQAALGATEERAAKAGAEQKPVLLGPAVKDVRIARRS